MVNIEEMDKFLESYNLSRLNHKETENPIRLITSEEIEAVIKKQNLSKSKTPVPNSFTVNYTKYFKKIQLILLKFLQKIE